ncbi:hypothetical protein EHR01_01525 [Leptospira mtsangambouensis]|uniref:Lipoprotein n=1 Tax=Leptospira mtsangambouensis TaxID=2484912 RepID=A0ABY2P2E9_9LEPT|nr:hypothetical protein EHR01_01525 [Leptospira mtsangambouensis]
MKTIFFPTKLFISLGFLLLFLNCSNKYTNHSLESCKRKCDSDQALCYLITLQPSSTNSNQMNLTCPVLYIGCHSKCDSDNLLSSNRNSSRSGSRSGGGHSSSGGGGHSSSGSGSGGGGSSGGGHGGGGH